MQFSKLPAKGVAICAAATSYCSTALIYQVTAQSRHFAVFPQLGLQEREGLGLGGKHKFKCSRRDIWGRFFECVLVSLLPSAMPLRLQGCAGTTACPVPIQRLKLRVLKSELDKRIVEVSGLLTPTRQHIMEVLSEVGGLHTNMGFNLLHLR